MERGDGRAVRAVSHRSATKDHQARRQDHGADSSDARWESRRALHVRDGCEWQADRQADCGVSAMRSSKLILAVAAAMSVCVVTSVPAAQPDTPAQRARAFATLPDWRGIWEA